MNRRKIRAGFWLFAVWCFAGACFAQNNKPADIRPTDFAYGIEVDTVGRQPVQAFVLPRTVYEHLTRDDLGDLRVFNSEGAAVPHALHLAAEMPEAAERTLTVPFFPVYGKDQQPLGDLGIQVQRTRAGTLVRIDEQARTQQQLLRAYIVDASQLDDAIRRLKFEWQTPPEDLLVNLTIETSNNLVNWQSWGKEHTLTSMRHNESVLIRNVLDLPAKKATYDRISWPSTATVPPIDQLEVTTAPDRPALERLWSSIPLERQADGIFVATIPGTIPADRMEIELPEAQTIIRVTVLSSASEDGPWIQHFSGLAYNLQAGDDQWQSPPISVRRNTHRYWRMTVDAEASGLLLGTPALRFGWVPARLLFIPQGPSPYTLAFGSATAGPSAFSSTELFRPVARSFENVFNLPMATLGPTIKLGGEERLKKPADIPWQKMILWGSMILGVVILGTMALRLMRKPAEGEGM